MRGVFSGRGEEGVDPRYLARVRAWLNRKVPLVEDKRRGEAVFSLQGRTFRVPLETRWGGVSSVFRVPPSSRGLALEEPLFLVVRKDCHGGRLFVHATCFDPGRGEEERVAFAAGKITRRRELVDTQVAVVAVDRRGRRWQRMGVGSLVDFARWREAKKRGLKRVVSEIERRRAAIDFADQRGYAGRGRSGVRTRGLPRPWPRKKPKHRV